MLHLMQYSQGPERPNEVRPQMRMLRHSHAKNLECGFLPCIVPLLNLAMFSSDKEKACLNSHAAHKERKYAPKPRLNHTALKKKPTSIAVHFCKCRIRLSGSRGLILLYTNHN